MKNLKKTHKVEKEEVFNKENKPTQTLYFFNKYNLL